MDCYLWGLSSTESEGGWFELPESLYGCVFVSLPMQPPKNLYRVCLVVLWPSTDWDAQSYSGVPSPSIRLMASTTSALVLKIAAILTSHDSTELRT